ncbi:MAG TPA: hypothetical protein VF784_11340, partial [Anaerolineales bacterium]
EHEIPVWRMIRMTPGEARARARAWANALGTGSVISSLSTVGGGSLPGESMKTYVLALHVKRPDRLLERLRGLAFPIIGRAEEGQVLLDPRTVLPEQDRDLVAGVQEALGDGETHMPSDGTTRRPKLHEI